MSRDALADPDGFDAFIRVATESATGSVGPGAAG